MRGKRSEGGLTDLESQVLSIILRFQPATAYQVRRAFSQSSSAPKMLSQGSMYPVVVRLKERGLIEVGGVGQREKTERLKCTAAGEKLVRQWLYDFSTALPQDPLSIRFFALPVLDQDARKAWIADAKIAVLESLARIEDIAQASTGTHSELLHDNARLASLARIRWLERVEARLDAMSAEEQQQPS
jgi:DNA-binding PadR family transcriptional regulator